MWTSQFCAKVITLNSLPQTSFGVRLSRIECVTNEPQRTSAGSLNFIVLYPYTKCSCKKTSNKLHQGVLTKIIFLGDFLACTALKLEKISPNFSSNQSLHVKIEPWWLLSMSIIAIRGNRQQGKISLSK